jgi:hypothetical protein
VPWSLSPCGHIIALATLSNDYNLGVLLCKDKISNGFKALHGLAKPSLLAYHQSLVIQVRLATQPPAHGIRYPHRLPGGAYTGCDAKMRRINEI